MVASKTLFAFLIVLGLTVTPASADVVLFSNLGPNDSFNTSTSTFFGFDVGEEGDPDFRFARAMAFVPSTTAPLQSLELPLQFPVSFTEGSLVVNLFAADASGTLPGALLESFTRTEPVDGLESFQSVGNPILMAGSRYFVEATTAGMADGLWFFSLKGHGLQPDIGRVNNGPWSGAGIRDFTAAFRVSGIGEGGQVPEPASLLLLGTGAAIVMRRRRRTV